MADGRFTSETARLMADRRKELPLGPTPKIRIEMLDRVAARRVQGYSLRRALDLERVPLEKWNETMTARPQLQALYREKESAALAPLLESLRSGKPGEWQKCAWILERLFSEDYGQSASRTVNNTINVIALGVQNDVLKRAREFAKSGVGYKEGQALPPTVVVHPSRSQVERVSTVQAIQDAAPMSCDAIPLPQSHNQAD